MEGLVVSFVTMQIHQQVDCSRTISGQRLPLAPLLTSLHTPRCPPWQIRAVMLSPKSCQRVVDSSSEEALCLVLADTLKVMGNTANLICLPLALLWFADAVQPHLLTTCLWVTLW